MTKGPRRRLADYRAKRDFTVTSEPAGKVKAASKKPIFCVQKHLARSLHYDFRLEHKGVLLSWAVPKGPSLDPKDKRFAARTEDHPLDYGDFEGVIPEGYGAGIVMLWDRGTWEPENGDVDSALKKGEIKLRLEGIKLKGSWVLVRTRASDAGKEQWLLIKHKDHWSGDVNVTEFAPLSVKSFVDFADILRAKSIPYAWRKRLPVQSGETAALLHEIVQRASSDVQPAKGATPKKLRHLPESALRFGAKRPKLTNLNKILYPNGFSKGQLIEFYTRVAPLILPHLIGRAATLKRYPDGVEGKAFFHKRCPEHRPPWVKTVRVTSEDGESIDYCCIEDISTLVWVANLAAIELHVPLALAKSPDVPTAMVFDLDPGEPAGLNECLDVARRLTAMFDHLKLRSFAKLSGKKGLHVLVPLNLPDQSFERTRTFARAVAQVLARDDPKKVTAIMRKDNRAGKVFIDWSQNARSKTTVCTYSLRAGSTPTISAPIDLHHPPKAVPVATDFAFAEADAFKEMNSIRQTLPAAL
jgi:bifunctional non-homologous end joining protein LigD